MEGFMGKADTVGLLGTAEVLQEHLTAAMCESVFRVERVAERRRLWTLEKMAEFWTAVVLRAPRSLKQALEEGRAGQGGFSEVGSSDQAFFARCQGMKPAFFRGIFDAITKRVLDKEPASFQEELREVGSRFAGVWVVDGSGLDAVAHRLKVRWDERAVVLPGAITAFYDLFHGVPRMLEFHEEARKGELLRVEEALPKIPEGTLAIGDRAFGVPRFFESLTARGLFGLARRSKTVKLRRIELLSRKETADSVLQDALVDAGSGTNGVPPQRLRCIYLRRGKKVLRLLTNVLDPARLSAPEALALYRRRWKVERMFYDLKEVLNLHRFYAANANAVAMQVYASAIVYVALRTAQARIARAVKLPPERLSPAKLFPRVAAAANALTHMKIAFRMTQDCKPGVKLREPPWAKLPEHRVPLASILIEPRKGKRRQRRYCAARRRAISLHHFTRRRKRA
jgi:hypothetical protein